MTLSSKLAGVLIVALTLGAAPPARAQDDDKAATDKVAKLRADLNRLQRQYDALVVQRELDKVEAALALEELKSRVAALQKQVARLSSQPNARVSNAFDTEVRTGSVRIQNDLDVPATVTIDGRSYVIAPGASRQLPDRAPGTIRYRVTADGFGVGPSKRAVVRADQTLDVVIFDPR